METKWLRMEKSRDSVEVANAQRKKEGESAADKREERIDGGKRRKSGGRDSWLNAWMSVENNEE